MEKNLKKVWFLRDPRIRSSVTKKLFDLGIANEEARYRGGIDGDNLQIAFSLWRDSSFSSRRVVSRRGALTPLNFQPRRRDIVPASGGLMVETRKSIGSSPRSLPCYSRIEIDETDAATLTRFHETCTDLLVRLKNWPNNGGELLSNHIFF